MLDKRFRGAVSVGEKGGVEISVKDFRVFIKREEEFLRIKVFDKRNNKEIFNRVILN